MTEGSVLPCPYRAAKDARDKRNLNGVIGIGAVLAVLGGMVAAYAVGGPRALLEAISKSGLPAAFSLIFVSEIGDKVGDRLPTVSRKLRIFLTQDCELGKHSQLSNVVMHFWSKLEH